MGAFQKDLVAYQNSITTRLNNSKLSKTNEDKKQIVEQLAKCLTVQRVYGTKNNLTETAGVFLEVLSDYKTQDIVEALKYHLQKNKDFPTPACIIKLIDGDNEFKPNMEVYKTLKDKVKFGSFLSSSEEAYMKKYEAYYV